MNAFVSTARQAQAPAISRRLFMSTALATAAVGMGCDANPLPSSTIMGGFNLAGLEFTPDHLPGRLDVDYVAPDPLEIAYYKSAGANVIRLPFLWERLQPELGGPFDDTYFASLALALDQAEGMSVILDAHQYGRRTVNSVPAIIGESDVSVEHFAAFWGALATRVRHNRQVIFGLVNEPHDQRMDALIAAQNLAIRAVREAGASQLILASGNSWSGAHSWAASGNAAAMTAIEDPANNFAFDVHQYLDARSSGAQFSCAVGAGARLDEFTRWCRAHRRRGFLGEFGASSTSLCLAELSTLLEHIQQNRDVWLGWTYWAGGAWWPEDYPLGVRPQSLEDPQDRPQMAVLRRFLQ